MYGLGDYLESEQRVGQLYNAPKLKGIDILIMKNRFQVKHENVLSRNSPVFRLTFTGNVKTSPMKIYRSFYFGIIRCYDKIFLR